MVLQSASPASSKTLLLFGPQALSFDETAFQQLRTSLIATEDRHRWILDTIQELPEAVRHLSEAHPGLGVEFGIDHLTELIRSLDDGSWSWQNGLPNTLLNPLVAIQQLVQYSSYLDLVCPADIEDKQLHASTQYASDTSSLGFCTGLLGAFAVSASTCDEELRKHGAAAIRIATLIGTVVDVQEFTSHAGPSRSFSAGWRSEEERSRLNTEIQRSGEVCSIPCSIVKVSSPRN